MLVLTRRPGEQIVIGNGIRVTVVSVGPGRVKIGIDAPPDVRIDRQEIHEKIQQEQAEQAADVLDAVGRNVTAEDATSTLVAGSETMAVLHNRIADALPPATKQAATPGEGSGAVPATSVNRLVRNRLPRKPR
jgi:carbon storage regulator